MSAVARWQVAAASVLVIGIKWLSSDGWQGVVGAGLIGLAVALIGEATDARIATAQRSQARRVLAALERNRRR